MSALKRFGVNKLIKKGARLFGSSGEEYDVKSSASWEKQRDALLREISMSSKDEDVPVLPSNRRIDRELHSDLVPSSSSSSTSVPPVENNSSDHRESASRLLLDTSKESTQENSDVIKTWPLLMTRLSSDLLSPTWHVRHGAAIGLASVIPHLGNLTSLFLEDCAVRCLCLLALDRFKDFYLGTSCCICSITRSHDNTQTKTGTARAPCAEAAARLISSLKKNPTLTYELFADVLAHDETPWPTRHSVLTAIHLMNKTTTTTTTPPSKLCKAVRENLNNTIEGVQVAAAQAFLSTTMNHDLHANLARQCIQSRISSFASEDEEDVVYTTLQIASALKIKIEPPISMLCSKHKLIRDIAVTLVPSKGTSVDAMCAILRQRAREDEDTSVFKLVSLRVLPDFTNRGHVLLRCHKVVFRGLPVVSLAETMGISCVSQNVMLRMFRILQLQHLASFYDVKQRHAVRTHLVCSSSHLMSSCAAISLAVGEKKNETKKNKCSVETT